VILALADTSFIISVLVPQDRHHPACQRIYHAQPGEIGIPQSLVGEISYMLAREAKKLKVARFFLALPQTKYRLISLIREDVDRAASLLIHYADSRLDFVDLSVAAVAERLELGTILTLDRRDFQIVRPRHRDRFMLLPEP
jgi:predicted nucleic acid-binding protein